MNSDDALGRVRGKTAIVTGGGRNIGRASALFLARQGASVAIVDLNEESALSVATEICNLGGKAIGLQADIRNEHDAASTMNRVSKDLGAPNVLVNNAVQGRSGPFLQTEVDDWDIQYEVGLRGYFVWSKAFARALVERELPGCIVSMSSIAAFRGNAQFSGYSAIKAGVVALTKVMATELAPHGIRANAVAPGVVDTDLPRSLIKTDSGWNERLSSIPLGRFGTCEEIAQAVLFLASDESSYVTGHTLCVDGGYLAAGMMES